MLIIKNFSLILFFIVSLAHAEYIEGIDTTDANGYGLDSALQVTSYSAILANFFSVYVFLSGASEGYYNYSYNDLKMAPVTFKGLSGIPLKNMYSCFILKSKDSLFSKVQILQKLSNGRYVFRFGKNTTPNDHLLEKSDYDRTILYKPNNLFNKPSSYPDPQAYDTTYWDPPLPNNNHLLGYIFYCSKNGMTIDTTAPIDLSQWDSIAYCTSTKFHNPVISPGFKYFNIVAVYSEGRSDFLKNWTYSRYSLDKISEKFQISSHTLLTIKMQTANDGIIFLIPTLGLENTIKSFSIFSPSGRELKRLSNEEIQGNRFVLKAPDGAFNAGMYIAKAQLSDKRVISKPFLISR